MIKSFSLISLLLSIFTFYQFPAQTSNLKNEEKLIMGQYDKIEYNDVGRITNMDDIRKVVDQSKKINFKPGEIRGLVLLQRNALRRGNYTLSEKYGDEAESLAYAENDNYSLSLIQLNRACVAIELGLYPEAKTILEKKEYGEKIGNKANRNIYFSNSYMLLAGIYSRTGAKDSMLYYTRKSLDAIEATPLAGLTDYQKVRYYYLEIFQLMNMGIAYAFHPEKPRVDLAESYFRKALAYSVTHPQYFKLCDIEVYESVSAFYYKKKEYEKSIEFSKKVLELERIKKKPEERLAAYEGIKDAYNALGNSTQELKYLKLYTGLNDSIKNAQKVTVINQSRKKIKTFRDAYNENRLIIALTALGIILLIIAIAWKYNRKKEYEYRKKYDELINGLNREKNQPDEVDGNKDQGISNISSETEKKLLKKLAAFENSDKFLKKGINIAYLSHFLNTNPKYLSEIIREHKSRNFNTYINSLRINYIVHQLYNNPKYREYKISYLAEECGYASPQVFVIAFKKEKGVTPSYFINQLNGSTVNIGLGT
ncbi:helix-turn-helix domain-containing protein [Chryseobacterium gallinarum]|uniref:helix-turn-helix domain-containing protein n=1 Tax=Chryseobacterium gallinarum TaxID=1324352 RepID=UPI000AFE845B|nr:helix-turn-helix domain-containing protein [Chryseobacterium gallinarum]